MRKLVNLAFFCIFTYKLKTQKMTTTIKSFELTDQNTGGTFGLGKMPDVTYEQLVRTFGEPNYGPSGDGKTQVEWVVKFINEQAGSLVYENLDNGQIVYFTKEILKTIKNQEKGI